MYNASCVHQSSAICSVVIDVVLCYHVPWKDCPVVFDVVDCHHLRKDCVVVIDDVVERHLMKKGVVILLEVDQDVDTCHLMMRVHLVDHRCGSVDGHYVFFCDGGYHPYGDP